MKVHEASRDAAEVIEGYKKGVERIEVSDATHKVALRRLSDYEIEDREGRRRSL